MLETLAVSKNFGKLAALKDVSFRVDEGEIFGIAGPNGAGKSTLFNAITGIYPASTGKVLFEGHEITRMRPTRSASAESGRTYQIPATFQTLSVYNNLRIGATFSGRSGKTGGHSFQEILEYLSLTQYADTSARNLDLYATKRVMLGAVLATNCRLLMLDEPMAGLSMVEITNFLEILRHINHDWGLTIIIIEHLLDILIGVTGRMMILDNGALLYLGPSSGVTQDRRVIEVYVGMDREVEQLGASDKSGFTEASHG